MNGVAKLRKRFYDIKARIKPSKELIEAFKMKIHYSKGDKIKCKFYDGNIYTGVVESQKGSLLQVRWDHLKYRPQDPCHDVDYRDLEVSEG